MNNDHRKYTPAEWAEIDKSPYQEKLEFWKSNGFAVDGFEQNVLDFGHWPTKLLESKDSFKEQLKFLRKIKNAKTKIFVKRRRDVLANIIPDTLEERRLYYEYRIEHYKKTCPEMCDIDYKISEFDNRLQNAPNRRKCILFEIDNSKQIVDLNMKVNDRYFLRGYESCLNGRPVNFFQLDNILEYYLILYGKTICLYVDYLEMLLSELKMEYNFPSLQWAGRGAKREVSELIYALYKSGKITYKNEGTPVTKKDLESLFKTVFSIELGKDSSNHLRPSVHAYMRRGDNNREEFFTYQLYNYIKEYKEDQ